MPEKKRRNEQIRILKRDLFSLKKRYEERCGAFHALCHEFQEESEAFAEEIARLESEIYGMKPNFPAAKVRHKELPTKIP